MATDFTHGLGEILTRDVGDLPEGDFLGYSQSDLRADANVPYNFGLVTQLLNEVYHTAVQHLSVRNIYCPEVTAPRS